MSTILDEPVVEEVTDTNQRICPRWNVLFLNDDYHSFGFVIFVLCEVFRKNFEDALQLTIEIHHEGQSIVETCSKERAELYLEQVSSIKEGKLGSIGCVMEPAE